MKPVFSHLRKLGHANVSYIDDSLLQADSYDQCVANIEATVDSMDSLGLTIHPEKSVLRPTRCITFLGFVLNSETMTICLTKGKADNVVHVCQELLNTKVTSIRHLAQVVGKMVACAPAVPHAPLFYKTLEHEKDSALKLAKGNFNNTVRISTEAREQVLWWINNIHQSANPVYRGSPDLVLETDSSGTGWGGLVKGDGHDQLQTGGHWSHSEQQNHINYLELYAAFLTLQCFCNLKRNIHVRLYMDNTVAVNYLNNMGGKKPYLHDLTREMWLWCKERDIWLSVCYLPGVTNVEADKLSRKISDDIEWSLNVHIFQKVCDIFGIPDIDLFASRINAQVTSYVSYLPDPTAIAVDAFSLSWSHGTYYALPPFSLLGRVLQKVEEDVTQMILIAPLWTTQPWFPKLLRLVTAPPVILPNRLPCPLLQLRNNPTRQHPMQKLRLIACKLSGRACDVREFRRQLPPSFLHNGGHPPRDNMGSISADGCLFASKGQLIRCNHL
ncbi:uncharacterized protein LOC110442652 [Mizuhopecten yessoensis]|uniref:uncharacterized protein LOC110442652 n=1 Tax=Mizuhopecten yessoensis TaxID=6573 RepID=UPI000B45ECFD|nr:uncharacterized protein LOC110442652 [Mizuhopecten yessoensis]